MIMVEAGILIFSGVMIICCCKCTGAFFLMLGVLFLVIIKDNPWMRHSTLRTTQAERNEKLVDFMKSLSLIGASILLMADKGGKKCGTGACPVGNVQAAKVNA